jgi:8-oxo-dGTP pyrophosphatase MutT (NUDIX family)
VNHYKQVEWLKTRLQQPLPGLTAQELMAGRVLAMPLAVPANARPSAVLCLLFPVQDDLHILLMKRMADNGAHSGQISFPGGRQEPADADPKATALREANEEVGIMAAEVEVIGALTPLYIPVSNFLVYPFVGYTKERPAYNLSKHEVADIIEVPLSVLLHAGRKTVVDVTSPAVPQVIRNVKAYKLADGTIIWGATAMIISELEVVLQGYVL